MTTNYGIDSYCGTAGLKSGRLVTGNTLLAQALYRRLVTPRGTLIGGLDEENYGLDLVGLLGTVQAESDAASLPSQIRNELLKDERVEDVTVVVATSESGGVLAFTITIDVEPYYSDDFVFKINVADNTATLMGLTGE